MDEPAGEDGHGQPPVLMKLYLYTSSQSVFGKLDPRMVAALQSWLK
jgi:hypothetical protein